VAGRIPARRARALSVLTLSVVVVAGCTTTAHQAVRSTTSMVPTTGAAGSTTMTSAAGPPVVVASLPVGCGGGIPGPGADLTFVAGGRAWAIAPDRPASLRCLFPVTNAGLWSWGPKGDRVLLDGLEVRGVGTPLSRPAANFDPSYYSWSRPTGTTVVFTDQSQRSIFRADMGYGGSQDITPVPGATYGDMAYHPSGLAIGFVAAPAGGPQELWMSTNTGTNPQLLVSAGDPGTTFGHIVFAHDGVGLYYSVDTAAGGHTLARFDLPTGAVAQSLWSGAAPIDDITELAGVPGVALTIGAACADRRAVFSALDGTAGQALNPGVPGPASVVGRLDADRFVVAVGGCNGASSDLYLVSRSGAAPVLIVRGVTTAAMRTPEPTPPPPLPQNLPRSGFT
jgi:hypothetical protein